ncbi:hypothetical protein ACWGQ2_17950 [Arthrobacter sp. NPDC055585]
MSERVSRRLVEGEHLWNSSAATDAGLANVIMWAPAGFKNESRRTVGSAHLTEHLIVTGDGNGPHLNGFTSDSVVAVYALCKSEEVDSMLKLIQRRTDPKWVQQEHINREFRSVSNETWAYDTPQLGFECLLPILGFSSSPGYANTSPPLSSVRQWMDHVSETATYGIFDPRQSKSPIILEPLLVEQHAEVSSQWQAVQMEYSDARSRVWDFSVSDMSLSQRVEINVSFALLNAYLQKRGGYAQIGFLDDCRFWLEHMWAAVVIPHKALSGLRKSEVRSINDIVTKIKKASPQETNLLRSRFINGASWIRHPVIREISSEMAHLAYPKLVSTASDRSDLPFFMDVAIV